MAKYLKTLLDKILHSTHDRILFGVAILYLGSELAATLILQRPVTPIAFYLFVPAILILPGFASAANRFRVHHEGELAKLKGDGRKTKAKIIAVNKIDTSSKIKGRVTFQYSVAGTTYKNHARVASTQDLDRMPVGASVQIVYAASKPQLSRLRSTLDTETADSPGTLLFSVIVGLIYVVISLANVQAIAQAILN